MRTLLVLLLAIAMEASAYAYRQHESGPGNSCPEPASNTIFAEVGGNGLSLSINYERLLSNNFSLRLGYGAFYGVGTSIPLLANFYFGMKYKLELGAGLVFLPIWKSDATFGKEKSMLFSSTAGFRFQPCDGGATIRLSVTPFFDPAKQQFRFSAGLSIGITF